MATLADQPKQIQDMFQGTWGGNAASQWASEDAAAHPGTGGLTTPQQPQNGQLQGALANLEAAINSGNQRQYDLALAQVMGVFQGNPTLGGQQLALDKQKLAETQREYNLGLQSNVLGAATKLQGPEDWGNFIKYTGGGKSLLEQAMTGRPSSGAPTGDMQPMTMQSIINRLGLGNGPATGAPSGAAGGPLTPEQMNAYKVLTANNGSPAAGLGQDVFSGFVNANQRNPNDAVELASYAKTNPGMGGGGGSVTGNASGNQDLLNSLGFGAPDIGHSDLQRLEGWNAPAPAPAVAPATDYAQWNPDQSSAYNVLTADNGSPAAGIGANKYSAYLAANNGQAPNGAAQLAEWIAANPDASYASPAAAATPTTPAGPNVSNVFDLLNSPDYRKYATANQGDATVQQTQDYERKLQMLNNPGQMDPAHWDSLGPDGQKLWLDAASQIYGWDPSEYVRQMNSTRPLGSPYAPQSTRTVYAGL